jgi:Cyclin, N-terminal domain
LSHECGILTLAYIERIMENSTVRLRANNWRRITLSAIILASKVWEDQAVWNVDFLNAFPCLTVKDLGQLEKKYLSLLSFNVSLSGSQYARYYFDLRELSDKEPTAFPLQPLDKNGQKRLEDRSRKHEAKTRRQTRDKGKSVDWEVAVRSPKVVLS